MALYRLTAAGLILLGGCGWFKGDEIPDCLLGVWVTSDPRYAEAQLEITKDMITFSSGLAYINMNDIDYVKVSRMDDKTLIKITYEDSEGGEFTLSLYHHDGPRGGFIRFVNQMQMVWERKAETD